MKSVYRIANGKTYYPYVDNDGNFILSEAGYGSSAKSPENYILEPDPERFVELATTRRYYIRMKAGTAAASLIAPQSLMFEETQRYLTPLQVLLKWRKERGAKSE